MNSINERIQFIVNEYYKGNVSAFGRDTEIKQSTLKDILGKKGNKPSADTLDKILSAKTLNILSDWLLKGEGKMMQNAEETDKKAPQNEVKEPEPVYGNEMIYMPREVFNLIKSQQNTLASQQRTIEMMQEDKKKIIAGA